jgi:hypothetical protein
MFSQRFLGNQSVVQKQKSYWCLSETNRFWKFRWFLREVSIHLETQKKTTQWSDSKSWVLVAWIMINHSAYSHESKAYRS